MGSKKSGVISPISRVISVVTLNEPYLYLNPKPLNPKPLNPKPLNPKPYL